MSALLGLSVSACTLHAQSVWSVDVGVGQSKAGSTGWYELESGAADVAVTRQHSVARPLRFLASAQLGLTFKNGTDTTCPIGPTGRCLPRLPTFRTGGVLVGALHTWNRMETAVRVGPAYFVGHDFERRVVNEIGLQAQADLAAYVGRRVGLTGTVRQTDVPSVPRTRYRTVLLGVRLR